MTNTKARRDSFGSRSLARSATQPQSHIESQEGRVSMSSNSRIMQAIPLKYGEVASIHICDLQASSTSHCVSVSDSLCPWAGASLKGLSLSSYDGPVTPSCSGLRLLEGQLVLGPTLWRKAAVTSVCPSVVLCLEGEMWKEGRNEGARQARTWIARVVPVKAVS